MSGTIDPRTFQMSALTDANGQATRDSFDALGRVLSIVKPGDSDALPSCAYEYRSSQLPLCVVSHERITSGQAPTQDKFQYANGRGEMLQIIVPGEGDAGRRFIVREAREYNARSLMSARTLPYYADSADYAPAPAPQPRLKMRFDALGRLVEQIGPDGTRATHVYAPGRVVTLDDASRAPVPQRTLTKFIDGLKRTIRVENQLADHVAVATYEYDAIGRLVRYTAPNGAVTSTTFDGLGRILAEQNPDSGRTVFVFDAAGNQVARTNAAGQTMRHTVDELDRLTAVKDDAAPDDEVLYTFDPPPPDGTQNRIGRLWKVADRLGVLEFSYDALGRVTRQARTVASLGRTFQTDWVYDALGHQTRITLPEPTPGEGRRIVDFRFNARGLPAQSPGFVKSVDYDVQGNIRHAQYQNGTQSIADFDLVSGRPQRQRLLAPDGVTALRDQTLSSTAPAI
jgi:YD repeat-containing protein